MKLLTYLYEKSVSCGILVDKGIIDIPASFPGKIKPHSVRELLIRGQTYLDQVKALAESVHDFIPVENVRILAPIPRPGKLLALAGNYRKHIIEAGRELGLSESTRAETVPRPFLMPSTVAIGPDSEVPWPSYSEQVDYEIELAVIIGRPCKCISPQEAPEYIAGYCIANDISARSVTFKENRKERPWNNFFDWLNGKWSDGFLPLGPYLTTADEIEDAQNLEMELKVNGETRQKANTSEMIFSITDTISFISHLMTLEPGDCIATGTPEGVAMATGKFLQPGDKIECTIEKLGTLSTVMGQAPDRFYKPLAE